MWEVFDYRDGIPIVAFRQEWRAKIYAHAMGRFFDYAKAGEGWV